MQNMVSETIHVITQKHWAGILDGFCACPNPDNKSLAYLLGIVHGEELRQRADIADDQVCAKMIAGIEREVEQSNHVKP